MLNRTFTITHRDGKTMIVSVRRYNVLPYNAKAVAAFTSDANDRAHDANLAKERKN